MPSRQDMRTYTTQAGNPPPLDLGRLLHQWNAKSSFVVKILDAFEREFGIDLENLRKAFSAGNAAQVASIAHRLKGAAATIGAESIRGEAASLEYRGHNGDLSLVSECIKRLESEFERYCSYRKGMEFLPME